MSFLKLGKQQLLFCAKAYFHPHLLINQILIMQGNTVQQRINPSSTTVLAMFNSMVGGAMLTMPILFKTSGILTGSIVLIVSGLISFITCRIYVIHMADEDNDVEWTIRRLLGTAWQKRFRLITGFYLILLCIIYIDLIVDQLYSIFFFFLQSKIAPKDGFAFDKFSTQWLTIIMFVPLLALIFIKNLNFMVKLSEYGSYSAFLYFAFVIYKFTQALIQGNIDLGQIKFASLDIGNLAGTCALAFTIHTMVITFVKTNKNQQKNERDLGYSYILGFLLYELIGIFGTMAISQSQTCKQTLVDCYLSDWTVLIVEVSYLFGRITVFPCTLQVARTRLIDLFFPQKNDSHFKYFNIAFMILAALMSILSPFIPFSLMMNIVGAVVCYFFIYLFPTMLHYKCLYTKRRDQSSLVESITSLEDDTSPSNSECVHGAAYQHKKSKLVRFGLYGVINFIGIAIGIYGLYTCIEQIRG